MNINDKDNNRGGGNSPARRTSRFARLEVMKDIIDSTKGVKEIYVRTEDVESVEVCDGRIEVRVSDGGAGRLFVVEGAERERGQRRPLTVGEIGEVLQAFDVVDGGELPRGSAASGRVRVKG